MGQDPRSIHHTLSTSSEPVVPAGCWEHENETCHLLRLPGSLALSVSRTQERYLFYGRHDCQRDTHLLSRIFSFRINKKPDLSKIFDIASSYIKYQNIQKIYIYICIFAIGHILLLCIFRDLQVVSYAASRMPIKSLIERFSSSDSIRKVFLGS